MAQIEGTPAAESHGDCQLPLGYDGVLRIRAAPHLVLRPEPQSQPTLMSLDTWQVMVGGGSENVVGHVPCRLEWIAQSDSFAERRMPHRRETCLAPLPDGKGFVVREKTKDGVKPLYISVWELGLLGTGSLGYKVEPLLFGNQPVEVKPGEPAAIPFDLGARIDFVLAPSELTSGWIPDFIERNVRGQHVGTLMQLKPDFPRLFDGLYATVDLYPAPPEGAQPDSSATVRIEWQVGHPDAARELMWKIGFLAVRSESGDVLNNRLAPLGGLESSEKLGFQYRLRISKTPPPPPPAPDAKKDKKKAAPPPPPPEDGLRTDPRLALQVPRPRLKRFEVVLDGGKLGVEGRFEHFHDAFELDLTLKPYVRVPRGTGWQVEELDDYFRNVLENTRLQTSYPIPYTEKHFPAATLCLPDDVSSRLAELETVTVLVRENAFERELLDLKQLPRHYVEVLKQVPGLQVFAAIKPVPVAGEAAVPFWAVADYEASEPNSATGFAPFDGGAFVSRVFASGVCSSNTVDLTGEVEKLSSPVPIVPPELQEEFSLFVGTVCGEALGQSETAWKAVAHTIMNRVARKFYHWAQCFTPTDVILKTGFDGHSSDIAKAARACLKSPASSSREHRDKIARVVAAVTDIYMRQAKDNCHDVVFFYSPTLQASLHAKAPDRWKAIPAFREEKGDKAVVDITRKVLGDIKNDFAFYAFQYPEKNPRMTPEEIAYAKANPPPPKKK